MAQEPTLKTYSFLDCSATIAGPGGQFSLGADAAAAEEGITIAPNGDIGQMTVGAGGAVMHTLFGDNSGKITCRFLKTSPTNQKLMAMFNLQTVSSALYGQNILRVADSVRGDDITGIQAAFAKRPEIRYSKAGEMLEWEFNVGVLAEILGA